MSEVHITRTEVIKTKTSISDEEKRIVQTMITLGSSKQDIIDHLLKRDLILVKSNDVTRVHFVESGELTKDLDKVRKIIDLDNVVQ